MQQLNWIDSLVEENKHVETPESWIWWSLLTCISAASGNNYFMKTLKGDLLYRPNEYIILLGESGLGKGFPINLAKRLVQKAAVTRVIAGRSSIQGIVQELATSKTEKDKAPITDSRALVINGELSTAIIADPDSLTILTDLYDGHYNDQWDNLLKVSGREQLKKPYITCLFGSSPAHFYDSIPQVNIEGGYIGRNLIIYEEKRSKDTDLIDAEVPDEKEIDKFTDYIAPKYVPHLTKIASNAGRLVPSESGRNYFNEWRKKWRTKQESDKTGFLNRVPDHIIKVAMCICLARYDNTGIIDELDFREAIQKVTGLIYANKKTAEGRGLDPLAAQTRIMLDFMLKAEDNELKRAELLRRGYGSFDAPTLDRIVDNLQELGWIKKVKIVAGSHTDFLLKLAGEPLINYRKFLAQKEK